MGQTPGGKERQSLWRKSLGCPAAGLLPALLCEEPHRWPPRATRVQISAQTLSQTRSVRVPVWPAFTRNVSFGRSTQSSQWRHTAILSIVRIARGSAGVSDDESVSVDMRRTTWCTTGIRLHNYWDILRDSQTTAADSAWNGSLFDITRRAVTHPTHTRCLRPLHSSLHKQKWTRVASRAAL